MTAEEGTKALQYLSMVGAIDSKSVATGEGAIVLQYFSKAGATHGKAWRLRKERSNHNIPNVARAR
jgi:hypothetical protein